MIRVGQHLGKFRVEKRIAEGGFATVYRARDTVCGVPVALKIPHPYLVHDEFLDAFRKEVRVTSQLDHPHILAVKEAGTIEGVFYVASNLGCESLADRLGRRLGAGKIAQYASQMLEAVAYAHAKRIVHCDIKPENFILFEDDRLRLADFGIAKVARQTLAASGSGTVGYLAPEQAMGKPSLRSDVFALGLVIYQMISGHLPEWPYSWPPPGIDRVRRCVHPQFLKLLHRSLAVDSHKRFKDATVMLRSYRRFSSRAVRNGSSRGRKKKTTCLTTWKTVRWQEFRRQYGRPLQVNESCSRCSGPMADVMRFCPWCGTNRARRTAQTRFPRTCPRCRRGVKSDWRYCPWCYGKAINRDGGYRYSDRRYAGRCSNTRCDGRVLMPFMSHCPWCRRKITRAWRIAGVQGRCPGCKWTVIPEFWDFCPWCGKAMAN